MSVLPPEPWHTVHIDFSGPFPSGEYLLVVIDAYSCFPEVDIVHSTKATSTISKLERIFATHGIPTIIKSNNGPPFTSQEFQSYMTEIAVKHQKITPHWPQANSAAENIMKPLTKAVRAAHTEKKNWKKELYMNASLFKTLKVDSFVDKGGDEYEDEDEDISDVSSEDDTPVVQNEDRPVTRGVRGVQTNPLF